MSEPPGHEIPLTRFAWLSIAAAIVTISMKAAAYTLTGSVGLLSDALESTVNLAAAIVPLSWPAERLKALLALVVGAEGAGLGRLVAERCDLLVRLPMRGKVAYLNAAVAGSIALYHAWRSRGAGSGGETT